jgi:class II vitamin B12-dependent ribonucleotide reductase
VAFVTDTKKSSAEAGQVMDMPAPGRRENTAPVRRTAAEVPAARSQVAADVLVQKYFRKAGVPARLKRVEEETSRTSGRRCSAK